MGYCMLLGFWFECCPVLLDCSLDQTIASTKAAPFPTCDHHTVLLEFEIGYAIRKRLQTVVGGFYSEVGYNFNFEKP